MVEERDSKFHGELKQLNEDVLKVVETNMKTSPYFDYTPTFRNYIERLDELRKLYPVLPKNQFSFKLSSAPPSEPIKTFIDANKTITNETTGDETNEPDEDGPPPESNVEVYNEPDAKFQVRCKLYERLSIRGGSPSVHLRGCGVLFVKAINNAPDKLHVIVRQDPDLRKVLLNQVITKQIPVKRGTKMVQIFVPDVDGETRVFVAKVKDENLTSQLFESLNSIKTDSR